MSKKPARNQQQETEKFVLPEIEIITKPEANVDLLTDKKNEPISRVTVAPQEVLPAVGEDATLLSERKYRAGDIQRALKAAGFDPGPIDGKLGPKTKKAVQDFQKKHNLTVDGVVGKKTWAKMKPYLSPSETKNE